MDAVEYHAASESGKAPYFQDKLTKLLSNQQIYEKIEQERPKDKQTGNTSLELTTKPSGRFNSKKQMELNLMMGEKKSEKITDNLLKTYGSNYSTLDKLVEGNLKKQESDIQKRYQQLSQTRTAQIEQELEPVQEVAEQLSSSTQPLYNRQARKQRPVFASAQHTTHSKTAFK